MTDTAGPNRYRSLFFAAAGLVCLFGMAACGDATAAPTSTGGVTDDPLTAAGTVVVATIELKDQGFAPDRIAVTQGSRLTLRNTTGSRQSVVVKGRDVGGNGDSIDLEPGESHDLRVQQVGAYVLTLADDPRITASILVS